MTPIVPVVPMLRAPGRSGADHQVRPWGNSPVGRPCCDATVDPDTWRVIPADQARHRCVKCEAVTA